MALARIELGALALVASPVFGPPPPEPRLLSQHASLVDRLHRAGPGCLPARFGTLLADAAAANALLRERQIAFATALARVADRDELALSAFRRADAPERAAPAPPTAADAPAGPGTLHLARLRAARAATAADEVSLAPLLAALADEAVALRREPPGSGASAPLRFSLLVERGRVGRVREVVAAASESGGTHHLVLTGPWPPYSFVEESV